MVTPAVDGIDLFKIANRSISGWIPSLKTDTVFPLRQPFCSQLEERLLLWLEYNPQVVSYALSGEPTILAFYERLAPFADEVAALFHRHDLPSRSALSRFLAALDEQTVEALRTQFLHDLFERATPFESSGGLWDRRDQQYVVIDVDGTRQAVRQRALPHLPTLPEPHRRFSEVAKPGYIGRKRGEVVRTRTTILQAHTHQWFGTFGGPGNKEPARVSNPSADLPLSLLTRSERAHWRLSWEQRLSRNARLASSSPVTITLHGLPAAFAQIYGFHLSKTS